jgi:hypothetical protein
VQVHGEGGIEVEVSVDEAIIIIVLRDYDPLSRDKLLF